MPMSHAFRWVLLPVLLLGFVASCESGTGEANAPDRDSATLRRRAMDEWYNDTPSGDRVPELWTTEYRQFLLDAARTERLRWGTMIPGGYSEPNLINGTTWQSLGPTEA